MSTTSPRGWSTSRVICHGGRIFGPNLYTDLLASTSLTSDNLGEINHLNELLWAITYFWNRLKEICISFKGLLGLPGNLSLLGLQFLNTIFCPKGDRVGVISPHVFMAQLPVVMITNTLLGILYPYPYRVTCGLNFTRSCTTLYISYTKC